MVTNGFVRVAQEEPMGMMSDDEETGRSVDSGHKDRRSERRKAGCCLLVSLTISMLGIGYSWSAQFARGASLFENMGLSDSGVSLAFLAGPICGLIVQPIIGALSDQSSSRFGRRRPWIAGGLGLIVMSFLLIGNAYGLGTSFGDVHQNRRPRALIIAVSAFWVLDFAQNAVQLPCRTLVSDILISEDVATGNAMFAFFDGIGKLISYLLGAVSLHIFAYKNEPDYVTDARAQFAIAALVCFICVGITVLSVSEPPNPVPSCTQQRSATEAAIHAWNLAYRVMTCSNSKQKERMYELVALRDDSNTVGSSVRAIEAITDATYAEWTERVASTAPTSLFDDDDDALARLKARDKIIRATANSNIDDERKEAANEDDSFTSNNDAFALPVDMETLRRVCFIELGLWFGLSAWQVWGALLVSKEICYGAPAAEAVSNAQVGRFQAGVMLYSLGNAGANLISLLTAPIYPQLLRKFGARFLFLISSLFMAIIMAALAVIPFLLTHTSYLKQTNFDHAYALLEDRDPRFLLTVLFLTALGLPWSAHMNMPFSVVGRAYQNAPDLGLYMATLNSSLCVAQLAMSFSTPILLRFAHNHVSVCFLAGALAGLFAAYHAHKLRVPYDETDAAFLSSSIPSGGH